MSLRRRTDLKVLYIEDTPLCTLFAGGLGFACQRDTAQWLSANYQLSGPPLARALAHSQDRALITTLLQKGWLEVDDE